MCDFLRHNRRPDACFAKRLHDFISSGPALGIRVVWPGKVIDQGIPDFIVNVVVQFQAPLGLHAFDGRYLNQFESAVNP